MFCAPFLAIYLAQTPSTYVRRPAQRRPSVQVYVNGQKIRFDKVVPVTVGRRILVPLRGVFEKLGATVTYDPQRRVVTAKRNGRVVVLWVDRVTARINGEGHLMDTYPRIRNGHVLVPIRFVAESLDCGVAYTPPENSVRIYPH